MGESLVARDGAVAKAEREGEAGAGGGEGLKPEAE